MPFIKLTADVFIFSCYFYLIFNFQFLNVVCVFYLCFSCFFTIVLSGFVLAELVEFTLDISPVPLLH